MLPAAMGTATPNRNRLAVIGAALAAIFAGALSAHAVTSIGTSITTDGNLSIAGTGGFASTLTASSTFIVVGSATFGDASSTDSVTFNARVLSNLAPGADNTYSLGDYDRRWKDLWLSGGSANIAYDTSGTSILQLGWSDTLGRRARLYSSGQPIQITPSIGAAGGIYLNASSDVGIGTSSPGARLTLAALTASPASNLFEIQNSTNSSRYFSVSSTTTSIANLTVGGGTGIVKHLSGTAADLTSASIGATSCGNYGTISVTGAAVGDTVYASPDAGSSSSGIEDSTLMWNAVVTAADTVTIRACNPSALAVDAGNDQEWRADVWKH